MVSSLKVWQMKSSWPSRIRGLLTIKVGTWHSPDPRGLPLCDLLTLEPAAGKVKTAGKNSEISDKKPVLQKTNDSWHCFPGMRSRGGRWHPRRWVLHKRQRKCSDGWEEAEVTGQELWFCLVYCFWVQTFRIGWANRLRVTCPDQPPGVSRTFFFLLLLMFLLHLSLTIPILSPDFPICLFKITVYFLIICDYFIVSSCSSHTDVLNPKP